MDENVIILGAGASADSGAPLMSNFLDKAEDLLSAIKDTTSEKSISMVFELLDELQKVHSKSKLDLNNIETVFGAIEMAQIIKRLGSIPPSEIPNYRNAIVKLIVCTIEQSMNYSYEGSHIYAPDSYANLMNHLSKNQPEFNTIITFNYDLGIDTAISRSNLRVRYGFEEDKTSKHDFNLYKLHGSINWASSPDNTKIYAYYPHWYLEDFHVSQPFSVRGNTKLIISNQLDLIRRHNPKVPIINKEPVIVPPTWNKTSYHGTISQIWEKAAEKLSKAKRIFVFGYSLPESDSFFRYLFALGTLSSTRIRNIVVVNPEDHGSEVDKRFHNLIGESIRERYHYQSNVFKAASAIISSYCR